MYRLLLIALLACGLLTGCGATNEPIATQSPTDNQSNVQPIEAPATSSPVAEQQSTDTNKPPAGHLYLEEYTGLLVDVQNIRTYEDTMGLGIIVDFSIDNNSAHEVDVSADTFFIITMNKEKIASSFSKSVDLQTTSSTVLPGGKRESIEVPFIVDPAVIDEFQFTDIWGDPIYRITNGASISFDITDNFAATEPPDNTDADAVDSNASAKADDYLYEEIYMNYEYALIDAINAGDFSLVEHMLLPGSSLYEEQKSLVKNLSDRGITEELVRYEILESDYDADKGILQMTVHEVVKVFKTDGESEADNTWVYTVIQNEDGMFQFTDLRKP